MTWSSSRIGRVTHFEIPAEDPKQGQRVDQAVFGGKSRKWNGPMDYWVITNGESGPYQKWKFPTIECYPTFKDTEGDIFGVMESFVPNTS